MSTGERIRKLREAKHMRQSDLAELLGNDGNTISRWENDKIGIGSAYIMKLAQVFNTTADYLLCKTDDPAPQIIPIEMDQNKNTKSIGFLIAVRNRSRVELPDTDKGYELFREILIQNAVMA